MYLETIVAKVDDEQIEPQRRAPHPARRSGRVGVCALGCDQVR
jgi:hypothetical protein